MINKKIIILILIYFKIWIVLKSAGESGKMKGNS